MNLTQSSGEGGAQSYEESELLDQLHLTCSENLIDEAGSASKHDSPAMLKLIGSMSNMIGKPTPSGSSQSISMKSSNKRRKRVIPAFKSSNEALKGGGGTESGH